MLVNESDRFGLDTISPRRWIHPMAHVMMIAIRDSKGKARWTTSVFEEVFEKERSSTSASLAVAQAIIGLGAWNGGSNSTNTSRSYNLCLHRSRQSCAVDRTAHRTGPSRRSTGSYPGLFGRALVAACLPKIKIGQSKVAKQLSPRLPHNAVSKNHGHFSKDYRNEFGELHPKL